MHTPTKVSLVTICSAVIAFNFASCKYEDGPKLTLKSKNSRLVGEWNGKIIGGDTLGNDAEFILEFEDDGDLKLKFTYSYTYDGTTYSYSYDLVGEWSWEDKKETIEIVVEKELTELSVKRLTSDELWAVDKENDRWELEKR
jgi:hypothetical protein